MCEFAGSKNWPRGPYHATDESQCNTALAGRPGLAVTAKSVAIARPKDEALEQLQDFAKSNMQNKMAAASRTGDDGAPHPGR